MIYIREQKTKKCPGLTSLFLEFNYHPQIIEVIKQCDGSQYDSKNKIWETPLNNLQFLLDHLCIIDDISLELVQDNNSIKPIYYEQDPNDSFQLFKHQKEAVEFGLHNDRWLLLDAPGLGKSNSIIKLAEELKARDNIQHCLIICGLNTLKYNWKKEINKFSKLQARVVGEHITRTGKVRTKSIADRVKELSQPLDEFFIIINIESLRNDDIIKILNKGPNKFDMIAIDECYVCKNASSEQGANLLKLKAKYQIGATGTLLLNDPIDCYMPLKWIGAERSTLSAFKYYYLEYGGPFNNMLVGFKNTELLKHQIESVSLRRTKDLLDLPPKNIIDEYVYMEPQQQDFYDNIKQGIVDQVDKVHMSTTNLLAMVTRLRQASEFPSLLTSENIRSAKIDRCLDLADQILSDPNEKLVIFSCFKEPCKYIYSQLSKYKPLLCTGDVSDSEISKNIDMFQTDDEHRVIVCTGQKMGTGITLNRARYAIFLSTPWTAGVTTQWQDRIHRIGTKNSVFIYNLWTIGTIDERVKDLIETKGALSDYVIDDEVSPQALTILRQYIEELR